MQRLVLAWKGTRDEALALRFDRSFASYHDFTLMLGFYFLQSISSRANKQTDKIDSRMFILRNKNPLLDSDVWSSVVAWRHVMRIELFHMSYELVPCVL